MSKELFKRILTPFYIPVLMLTTLLLIIKSKESINFTLRRIIVFTFGFFIIIFSETSLRMVDNEIVQNIKIAVIPFLLILILYFIFYRSFYFKSSNLK